MTSEAPLYERDPEAWHAYLAEGNAKQARKRVSEGEGALARLVTELGRAAANGWGPTVRWLVLLAGAAGALALVLTVRG